MTRDIDILLIDDEVIRLKLNKLSAEVKNEKIFAQFRRDAERENRTQEFQSSFFSEGDLRKINVC